MPTDIHVRIEDRCMWIELDRPDARNAIRKELNDDLLEALAAARENPDVRAIVITGRGPAFCAGGDVKGMGRSLEQRKPDINASRASVLISGSCFIHSANGMPNPCLRLARTS